MQTGMLLFPYNEMFIPNVTQVSLNKSLEFMDVPVNQRIMVVLWHCKNVLQ
jgi:hypothetical protein